MARGLRAGDGGAHLMTFHPPGGNGSSTWFHDDDVARLQHAAERPRRRVHRPLRPDARRLRPHAGQAGARRRADLRRSSGLLQRQASSATRSPSDVRRPLYWDLFTGAFGHTYGHHSVWQMWTPGAHADQQPADAVARGHRPARRGADAARPRADGVAPVPHPHSRSDIIVTDRVPTSVPGAGRYHFAATRDASGSYAMVYAPVGRPFNVRMNKITGARVKAWWFNPRTGAGHRDRQLRQHRASASSRRPTAARCWTGCSSSTTSRRSTLHPVHAGRRRAQRRSGARRAAARRTPRALPT